VPSILYTTQLPLPPAAKVKVSRAYTKPLHNAQYWSDRMRGMNFTVEDKLDTERYNKALWQGLKGEDVPYPTVRDGRNLRSQPPATAGGLSKGGSDKGRDH